jgi:hypothetical protein
VIKQVGVATLLLFALVPTAALAQQKPEWAFPITEKVQPKPLFAPDRVRTVGNASVKRHMRK